MFPEELSGYKFNLVSEIKANTDIENSFDRVPSGFWTSKVMAKIPTNAKSRSQFCYGVMGIDHKDWCSNKEFHHKIEDECICEYYGERSQVKEGD